MDNKQELIAKIKALAKEKDINSLIQYSRNTEGEEQLISSFAAAYKALCDGVKLVPFDQQIWAGLALTEEKVVELATGEGKTLSAVFAACYNSVMGRQTHILTYNDYLAKRDYNWMLPAYKLLGISCGFVQEDVEQEQRKAAYQKQITYLSAKECCFDFLRDFTAKSREEIVSGELCAAIVDEADSILIDEARTPLVVAGDMEAEEDERLPEISEFVKNFSPGDYKIDMEEKTVYLTDNGACKAEKHYKLSNLYDSENNELLMLINDCLKAWFLLEEDKDYIVRDGEIRLIDEFTGRAALNRHYPGFLQNAVELKHGLKSTARGMIMGEIPLQFFLGKYKYLSGMTGTAKSAQQELFQLYDLRLEEIPPHVPCIRIDREPEIYYDTDSKTAAVVKAVKKAQESGQPVLLGTENIADGERFAKALRDAGITDLQLLTAKNDEMEAKMIRDAGKFGMVTVSAGMAGRGVDIKLGGPDGKDRERVAAAGGLLIIGTYLAASGRINKQLTGRSGRQGDPGESRLYISLDEPIMEKFKLKSLVPKKHWPQKTSEKLTDRTLFREVMRIQRISEGDSLDRRERLLKFTMIGEKHRDQIFAAHKRFLSGEKPEIWKTACPELYQEALAKYGEELLEKLERETAAALINRSWCDYLEYTSSIREGIHLSAVGGKNPAEEYNIIAEEYYQDMEQGLREDMEEALEKLLEDEGYRVKTPEHIRTYLLEDNGDELNKKPILVGWLGEPDYEFEEEAGDNQEYADQPEEDMEKGALGMEEQKEPMKESSTIFTDGTENHLPEKKKGFWNRFRTPKEKK